MSTPQFKKLVKKVKDIKGIDWVGYRKQLVFLKDRINELRKQEKEAVNRNAENIAMLNLSIEAQERRLEEVLQREGFEPGTNQSLSDAIARGDYITLGLADKDLITIDQAQELFTDVLNTVSEQLLARHPKMRFDLKDVFNEVSASFMQDKEKLDIRPTGNSSTDATKLIVMELNDIISQFPYHETSSKRFQSLIDGLERNNHINDQQARALRFPKSVVAGSEDDINAAVMLSELKEGQFSIWSDAASSQTGKNPTKSPVPGLNTVIKKEQNRQGYPHIPTRLPAFGPLPERPTVTRPEDDNARWNAIYKDNSFSLPNLDALLKNEFYRATKLNLFDIGKFTASAKNSPEIPNDEEEIKLHWEASKVAFDQVFVDIEKFGQNALTEARQEYGANLTEIDIEEIVNTVGDKISSRVRSYLIESPDADLSVGEGAGASVFIQLKNKALQDEKQAIEDKKTKTDEENKNKDTVIKGKIQQIFNQHVRDTGDAIRFTADYFTKESLDEIWTLYLTGDAEALTDALKPGSEMMNRWTMLKMAEDEAKKPKAKTREEITTAALTDAKSITNNQLKLRGLIRSDFTDQQLMMLEDVAYRQGHEGIEAILDNPRRVNSMKSEAFREDVINNPEKISKRIGAALQNIGVTPSRVNTRIEEFEDALKWDDYLAQVVAPTLMTDMSIQSREDPDFDLEESLKRKFSTVVAGAPLAELDPDVTDRQIVPGLDLTEDFLAYQQQMAYLSKEQASGMPLPGVVDRRTMNDIRNLGADPLPTLETSGERRAYVPPTEMPDDVELAEKLQELSGGDVEYQQYLIKSLPSLRDQFEREVPAIARRREAEAWEAGEKLQNQLIKDMQARGVSVEEARRTAARQAARYAAQVARPTEYRMPIPEEQKFLPYLGKQTDRMRRLYEASPTYVRAQQQRGEREAQIAERDRLQDLAKQEQEAERSRLRLLRGRGTTVLT